MIKDINEDNKIKYNLEIITQKNVYAYNNQNNTRMYKNFNNRKWNNLKPEAIFKYELKTYLNSYLSNPKNLKEIEDIINLYNYKNINIINIVYEITEKLDLNNYISEIAKNHIYENLLFGCWDDGYNISGTNSTYKRKNIIKKGIENEFKSDVFSGNPLYIEIYQKLTNANKEGILRKIKFE